MKMSKIVSREFPDFFQRISIVCKINVQNYFQRISRLFSKNFHSTKISKIISRQFPWYRNGLILDFSSRNFFCPIYGHVQRASHARGTWGECENDRENSTLFQLSPLLTPDPHFWTCRAIERTL